MKSHSKRLTILSAIVQNNLRLLQTRQIRSHGIIHIGAHIIRIHASKAGGMQVNQIVEAVDDFVHNIVGEYLRCGSITLPWKQPVQVFSVTYAENSLRKIVPNPLR